MSIGGVEQNDSILKNIPSSAVCSLSSSAIPWNSRNIRKMKHPSSLLLICGVISFLENVQSFASCWETGVFRVNKARLLANSYLPVSEYYELKDFVVKKETSPSIFFLYLTKFVYNVKSISRSPNILHSIKTTLTLRPSSNSINAFWGDLSDTSRIQNFTGWGEYDQTWNSSDVEFLGECILARSICQQSIYR